MNSNENTTPAPEPTQPEASATPEESKKFDLKKVAKWTAAGIAAVGSVAIIAKAVQSLSNEDEADEYVVVSEGNVPAELTESPTE